MATLSQFGTGQQSIGTPNAPSGGVGGYNTPTKRTKDLSATINSIMGKVSNISGSIASQIEQDRREELQLNVNTAQSIGLSHSRQLNEKIKDLETQVLESKLSRNDAIKQLNDYNIEANLLGSDGLSKEGKEAYDRVYLNPSISKINSTTLGWAKEQKKIDQELVLEDTNKAVNELGIDITPEQVSALKQGLVNIGLSDTKVESSVFKVTATKLQGDYAKNPKQFFIRDGKFMSDEEVYALGKQYFTGLSNSKDELIKGSIDKTIGAIIKDKNTHKKSLTENNDDAYYKLKSKLENAKQTTSAGGKNIDLKGLITEDDEILIQSISSSKKNTISNIQKDIYDNQNSRTIVKNTIFSIYNGTGSNQQVEMAKNVLDNGKVITDSKGNALTITSTMAEKELSNYQTDVDSFYAGKKSLINNDELSYFSNYVQTNYNLDRKSNYTEQVENRMTTNNFAGYTDAEEIINESEQYKVISSIEKVNNSFATAMASQVRGTYDSTMKEIEGNPKYKNEDGSMTPEGKKLLLSRVMTSKTETVKRFFGMKYEQTLNNWIATSREEIEENWINESVSDETLYALKDHMMRKNLYFSSKGEFVEYAKKKLVSTQGLLDRLAMTFDPFDDDFSQMVINPANDESQLIDGVEYFVDKVLKADDIDDYILSNEIADDGSVLVKVNRKTEDGIQDKTYYLNGDELQKLSNKNTQSSIAKTLRDLYKIKSGTTGETRRDLDKSRQR